MNLASLGKIPYATTKLSNSIALILVVSANSFKRDKPKVRMKMEEKESKAKIRNLRSSCKMATSMGILLILMSVYNVEV